MAISGGDGSIILSTKVDTSGIKQGTQSLKSEAAKLAAEYRKAGLSQSDAFKKAWSEIERTRISTEEATVSTKKFGQQSTTSGAKATAAISKISLGLKSLLTYFIGIQTVFAAIRFSGAASEFATQTEASVQRLIDIYGEASESVGSFIDKNAHALGMSRSAAAQFSSVYGNLFSVWADQKENAELTTQYLNATAVVASKTGRTMEDVQERIRSGLLGNTEAVEDLGIFVNVKTIEITDAFKRIADGRSWEQLTAYEQSQVRTLAILEQATKKYGTEVADTTALTKARYNAAFEDFKNTWGKIVNIVLIPVLKVATQVLNVLTAGLTTIAKLSGKTIDSSQVQQADSIQQSVENQDALTESVKETAEEQKKLLAGFDEITKLSETEKESTAGVVNDSINTPTTSSPFTLDSGETNKITTEISSTLATIMSFVGPALIALGLLLIVTGHIAWGIGFIIAGATALGVTMATLKSDSISQEIKDKITSGLIIAGLVAIAIGILLCFAQHWGLGIGLIAVGASSIVGAVALNWNGIKQKIQGVFGKVLAVAGITAIVIGILLCAAQMWGIGIGLIAVGAVAVGTTVTVNWNTIKNALGNFFKNNTGLIVGVSSALLILGIILVASGAMLPLGISLIAVGAGSLVSQTVINWNTIKNKISEFFKNNKGLIIGVSSALLILGIILCMTGVALPLAIGLIVSGASGLASQVALNWNTIKTKTSETFNQILNWIKTWGLLVLGVILVVSGVALPLGIALLIKGGQNLAQAQNPLWNTIVSKVQEVWEKIRQFWNTHIAKYFTAQWWSDLAKRAGNGLINGFEAAVNGLISLFENMINWVVSGLNSISVEIPEWVPNYGGGKFGVNLPYVRLGRVSIPRLAQGAVIPPNKEFLAVLGDQKHGTNIETPLQTMVEAFNIALNQRNDGNQTIVLTVDGDVLFRTVVNKNRDYVNAMGVNPLGI